MGYFCPFTPLTAQRNKILKKWKKHLEISFYVCVLTYDQMMYGSWDMVHDKCNCYFSLWVIFCSFTHSLSLPPAAQKIKILKKWKNMPWDLHMCTKHYDQMIYGSWYMTCDGWNYFSLWVIFWTFTSVTAQKTKILKTWKTCLEILSFYICVPKIIIRQCTVSEIWCMTDIIVVSHFGLFFVLLPS